MIWIGVYSIETRKGRESSTILCSNQSWKRAGREGDDLWKLVDTISGHRVERWEAVACGCQKLALLLELRLLSTKEKLS